MSIKDIGDLKSTSVPHQIIQQELELLRRQKQDLEDEVNRLKSNLADEIRDRHVAGERLKTLIEAISREKGDLEILVQILIDQRDESAHEGEKARIDGLTQIPNRRRFDEYLSQEWTRHIRMQRPLSLLVCDVDHFKLYNDSQGHQAGDECLKAVAKAINQCFRSGDLVARYGGEEFAMVLPQTDRTGAVQVAERVRSAVAAAALPHPASLVSQQVTISIGVATQIPSPSGPSDPKVLIEEADKHLYLAKKRGRNRVNYQDEEATT